MIDTVVFDIGNVLIDWNAKYLYRTLFKNDAAIERFYDEADFWGWNHEQDRGRPFAEGVAIQTQKYPQYEEAFTAYLERYTETIPTAIEGTVVIMQELQAMEGIRVCGITNYARETFDKTLPLYPFLDTFEGLVVSGDVGKVKPDADIFEHFYDFCNVEPSKAVFIDDKQKNADGAEATGMKGLVFTTPEKLRSDLRELGLGV